jgi:hypothetical protein
VQFNWFKVDPWMFLRMQTIHLWHPSSALSTNSLVHSIFFSPGFPSSKVDAHMRLMPAYESMAWPLGKVLPFAKPSNIINSIQGWRPGCDRLLVLGGGRDVIMTPQVMRDMAVRYRKAASEAVRVKKIDAADEPVLEESTAEDEIIDGENPSTSSNGVRFAALGGTGHHLQNDTQRLDGAKILLSFLEQL